MLLSVENGAVSASLFSIPRSQAIRPRRVRVTEDGLPTGRYLAPRNGRILIQPVDPGLVPGAKTTRVQTNGLAVHSPAWLEDGHLLLFADANRIFQWDRKKGTVQVYAADGGLGGMSVGPKRFTTNSRQSGRRKQGGMSTVWLRTLDREEASRRAPPSTPALHSVGQPSGFSPDGRQIAFVSTRSGAPELYGVCDADGGAPRQLTHLGAHVLNSSAWSPDGTQIAFHARVPRSPEPVWLA